MADADKRSKTPSKTDIQNATLQPAVPAGPPHRGGAASTRASAAGSPPPGPRAHVRITSPAEHGTSPCSIRAWPRACLGTGPGPIGPCVAASVRPGDAGRRPVCCVRQPTARLAPRALPVSAARGPPTRRPGRTRPVSMAGPGSDCRGACSTRVRVAEECALRSAALRMPCARRGAWTSRPCCRRRAAPPPAKASPFQRRAAPNALNPPAPARTSIRGPLAGL